MEQENIEKIGKTIGTIFLVLLIILSLLKSIYVVGETEQAVVTTFGKVSSVQSAGLHFKIPYVQKVKKVDTTIKGFTIGYAYDEDGNMYTVEDESIMITSDMSLINIDFYAEAQATDAKKFLYASASPYEIYKNVVQEAIRTVVSSYEVDSVMTTNKAAVQAEVKELVVSKMEELDIGLSVGEVTIQDAEPPTAAVVTAFKEVENAKQAMDTKLNEAEEYKNVQLLNVEAKVDNIVKTAEGKKASRIAEAEGQVARFNEMYNEYIHYPEVTKKRMFFETMSEVLPNMKVIIQDEDNTQILEIDGIDINKK